MKWEVRMENELGEEMHINATSEFGDEDSLTLATEIIKGAKALFRKDNMVFSVVAVVEEEDK